MEVWKDVVGYKGLYQVSNHGRVFSIKSNRLIKGWIQNDKYKRVCLYRNGKSRQLTLSNIILKAFKDSIRRKRISLFLDLDTLNCINENLEWATRRQHRKYVCHVLRQSKNANKPRGVYFYPITNRYRAVIKIGKRVVTLGYYETKKEAQLVFINKFEQLHGYLPW